MHIWQSQSLSIVHDIPLLSGTIARLLQSTHELLDNADAC